MPRTARPFSRSCSTSAAVQSSRDRGRRCFSFGLGDCHAAVPGDPASGPTPDGLLGLMPF